MLFGWMCSGMIVPALGFIVMDTVCILSKEMGCAEDAIEIFGAGLVCKSEANVELGVLKLTTSQDTGCTEYAVEYCCEGAE
jgi:uncharacterized protein YjbK